MSRLSDLRDRYRRLSKRIGVLRAARKVLADRWRENKQAREAKRAKREELRAQLEKLKADPDPSPDRLKRIKATERKLERVNTRIDKLSARVRKQGRKLNRVKESLDRLTARRRHIRRKIKYLKEHKSPKPDAAGFTTIDGRQVPNWMAPWVKEIRSRGWSGTVVSGFRTPEYSESLCIAMCGAPTCPGRCAGRYSNHACPPTGTGVFHEGAIDVSSYYEFGAIAKDIGAPFHNGLPDTDPVHFSWAGN